MAQQLITIGADDAGNGDTPPVAFDKTNDNFTDLYSQLGADKTVYLSEEADFPNQTATTITLDANTSYVLMDSFSTAKSITVLDGVAFSSPAFTAHAITFTGSGVFMTAVDASIYIHDVQIIIGATNQAFDFSDTVGQVYRFTALNLSVLGGAKWGRFEDIRSLQCSNTTGLGVGLGIELVGAPLLVSLERLAFSSTSASFKGVDFGSATATVIEMNNLFFTAPAGAYGISGLASSGNVPAGRLATVSNSEFLAGMTDLENITTDDIRWRFSGNNPTADTQPDALTSFSGNATETVISASSTDASNAVLVAGTWVEVQSSLFSTTAAGRITYLAERDLKGPVDVSLGLISAGGGAITVKIYLFFNGVAITASGIDVAISGSSPRTLSLPWQLTFEENDYIEVFVENQTNTTNIIVDHAFLRVL